MNIKKKSIIFIGKCVLTVKLSILFYIGSSNDAGIFQRCDLGQALNAGEVDLSALKNLPGTNIICPLSYCF